MKYTIEKSRDKDDFDNGNYFPSDGGLYTAEKALEILESGNGGAMTDEKGKSYIVNYDKSQNQWLRDLLKIK